jgi:hypothetical protein
LTSFRPSVDRRGKAKPLREWSAPLVAGAPAFSAALVEALRPTLIARGLRLTRHPLLRRARRLVRRLGRLPLGQRTAHPPTRS